MLHRFIAVLCLSLLATNTFAVTPNLEITTKPIPESKDVKGLRLSEGSIAILVDYRCAGVILDQDFILTAAHCATELDASKKLVLIRQTEIVIDGGVYTARLVKISIAKDLALLQIQENHPPFRAVKMNTTPVKKGQKCWVIGHPAGMYESTSHCTISHPSQDMISKKIKGILFDASIYGGNSGGALFNERFEFIGLVTELIAGWGLAVNPNVILKFLAEHK